MERRTATVSELVRRAVEVCDAAGVDADLGRLEDDDVPVTRLRRSAVPGRPGRPHGYDRDPDELITLAVRRQWGKDPPEQVTDRLAAR